MFCYFYTNDETLLKNIVFLKIINVEIRNCKPNNCGQIFQVKNINKN